MIEACFNFDLTGKSNLVQDHSLSLNKQEFEYLLGVGNTFEYSIPVLRRFQDNVVHRWRYARLLILNPTVSMIKSSEVATAKFFRWLFIVDLGTKSSWLSLRMRRRCGTSHHQIQELQIYNPGQPWWISDLTPLPPRRAESCWFLWLLKSLSRIDESLVDFPNKFGQFLTFLPGFWL